MGPWTHLWPEYLIIQHHMGISPSRLCSVVLFSIPLLLLVCAAELQFLWLFCMVVKFPPFLPVSFCSLLLFFSPSFLPFSFFSFGMLVWILWTFGRGVLVGIRETPDTSIWIKLRSWMLAYQLLKKNFYLDLSMYGLLKLLLYFSILSTDNGIFLITIR